MATSHNAFRIFQTNKRNLDLEKQVEQQMSESKALRMETNSLQRHLYMYTWEIVYSEVHL